MQHYITNDRQMIDVICHNSKSFSRLKKSFEWSNDKAISEHYSFYSEFIIKKIRYSFLILKIRYKKFRNYMMFKR
jgi:hypothetical protein